jgi:hypothetical protein
MSISIPYRITDVGMVDGVRMSNMNPDEDLDDIYGLGVVIDCNSGIGRSSNVDVVAVEMEDGDNDVGMVVIGIALVLVKEEDDDDDDDDVVDDAVGNNVVTIDMEIEVVSDNDTGVLLELVVSAAASVSDNGSDGCSALSSIFDDDEVEVGASVVVAAVGDNVGISSFTSLSVLAQPLPIITVSLLPYLPFPLCTSTLLTSILYLPLP